MTSAESTYRHQVSHRSYRSVVRSYGEAGKWSHQADEETQTAKVCPPTYKEPYLTAPANGRRVTRLNADWINKTPVEYRETVYFEPTAMSELGRTNATAEATPTMNKDVASVQARVWFDYFRRPWTHWWRYVLGLGAVAAIASSLLYQALPDTHPLYTGVMAAWIPLSLVTFFWELDHSRRVNIGTIVGVLLMGGIGSFILSLMLYDVVTLQGDGWAGIVEEPAKAVMLSAFLMNPKKYPGILSGLTLGVAVGAGFAIIETFGYAYRFSGSELPSTAVLLLRGLLSPLMHTSWTAALAGALWKARGPGNSGGSAFLSGEVWLILIAMIVFHGFWNVLGPLTYASVAVWALIFRYVKCGVAQQTA